MAALQEDKPIKIEESYVNQYVSPQAKNFYLNIDSADAYFIYDNERIPAHKVIMSIACDAFNAMFHGGLRERGDVQIVDASADGFKEFLRFFYFDLIQLSMKHIVEVVYLCAKYVYSSGLRICECFLLDSLSIENVCFNYGLAITYNLNELKQKCEEMINQNTLAVFQTVGFLDCDKFVLAHILKLDRLSCFEIDVFRWCMAWVKATVMDEKITRKLIDEQLGDLFHDIRIGSMSNEHLNEVLSNYSDLFAVDEHQEIVQLIESKDHHSVLFKEVPRLFQWNDGDNIIERLCPWNEYKAIQWPFPYEREKELVGWVNFHKFESTSISTTKHIVLGEIALKNYLSSEKDPVELSILEKSVISDGTPRIILQQQIELNRAGRFGCNLVQLQKKVVLSPNLIYEIQLKIDSFQYDNKYCGNNSYKLIMPKISIDPNTIQFPKLSPTSLISAIHFNMVPSNLYRF